MEGVALAVVVYALVRKFGKPISDSLEADVIAFRNMLYNKRNKEIQALEKAIKDQLDLENVLECRHEIFKIKHVRICIHIYVC